MRCDDARVAVSQRADGELPDGAEGRALDAHVASCAACGRFEADIHGLRTHLRLEQVDRAPDLGPAVTARLRATATTTTTSDTATAAIATGPAGGRRLAVAAAVAAVAGLVAGAAFVGIDTQPRSPAAADVPDLVVATQRGIDAVDSRFTITERPLATSMPGAGQAEARTFDGHLTFRAPEALSLAVRETPASAGTDDPLGGRLVVDGDRWWQETARECSPAAGLVRCPAGPLMSSRSVAGRAPFSDAAPVPLELVSPVDSFSLAAAPPELGRRTIAGHRAVGVAVTAAQVAPLVDGLSAGVELRPVHPGDPVELWLDDEHMVPLELVVRAADDPARARWAATVGADDQPGEVILTVDAVDVRINDTAERRDGAFEVPAGASTATDAGFRATPPDDAAVAPVPIPGALPDGFRAHLAGTVSTSGGPPVGVRSWSDGRAWLTVRATGAWPGGRLFGDLGLDVRPLDLGTAGVGYASSDGRRVGLHTEGLDVVVNSSLPPDDLRAIAADLGVVGESVPADWAESTTATLDDAATVLPGLLVARSADGFGPPSVRIDGEGRDGNGDGRDGGGDSGDAGRTITQSYAGPGRRAFALTQRRSPVLPPPSAGDETGVEVRGTPGRHSQSGGELEWIEDGVVLSLRSDTLGLGELLAIAERLEPA